MSFIKRNMPVLVIGGLTILVFLGIIILGQNKPPISPVLTEVSDEQLYAPHSYFLGNEDAATIWVEFSDFQCPACAAFHPVVKSLAEKYPQDLKIIYRQFPLPQHKNAQKAAEAAQISGEQGKFWEYGEQIDTAIKDAQTKKAQENIPITNETVNTPTVTVVDKTETQPNKELE